MFFLGVSLFWGVLKSSRHQWLHFKNMHNLSSICSPNGRIAMWPFQIGGRDLSLWWHYLSNHLNSTEIPNAGKHTLSVHHLLEKSGKNMDNWCDTGDRKWRMLAVKHNIYKGNKKPRRGHLKMRQLLQVIWHFMWTKTQIKSSGNILSV